ncbi:hypothetical protein GW17_00020275 [Ensete ventricosum]|nr:hypothetical protein GW17_00020275 [Ensete ventricosum]
MVPFDSRRSVYRSYRMVDSEGHLPSSVSGSGNSSTPRWRRLLRLCRGTTTPCDGSASCRSPSLWFPLHAYVHMRVRSRFETRTHFTTKRISFVRGASSYPLSWKASVLQIRHQPWADTHNEYRYDDR